MGRLPGDKCLFAFVTHCHSRNGVYRAFISLSNSFKYTFDNSADKDPSYVESMIM
jgi:hypothetical protein